MGMAGRSDGWCGRRNSNEHVAVVKEVPKITLFPEDCFPKNTTFPEAMMSPTPDSDALGDGSEWDVALARPAPPFRRCMVERWQTKGMRGKAGVVEMGWCSRTPSQAAVVRSAAEPAQALREGCVEYMMVHFNGYAARPSHDSEEEQGRAQGRKQEG
jgi:hypothetical protein